MSRVWRFLPAFVRRQVIRERLGNALKANAALGVAARSQLAGNVPQQDTTRLMG